MQCKLRNEGSTATILPDILALIYRFPASSKRQEQNSIFSKQMLLYFICHISGKDSIRSGASKGCVFSRRLKGRTIVACGSRRSHMQIVPSRAPVAKRSATCSYF